MLRYWWRTGKLTASEYGVIRIIIFCVVVNMLRRWWRTRKLTARECGVIQIIICCKNIPKITGLRSVGGGRWWTLKIGISLTLRRSKVCVTSSEVSFLNLV